MPFNSKPWGAAVRQIFAQLDFFRKHTVCEAVCSQRPSTQVAQASLVEIPTVVVISATFLAHAGKQNVLGQNGYSRQGMADRLPPVQ